MPIKLPENWELAFYQWNSKTKHLEFIEQFI